MYAPASSIRKTQMQKFVRKPTGARLGSEAAPWAKDSEYHLGGMTNIYPTGPKKGQDAGDRHILPPHQPERGPEQADAADHRALRL